MRTLILTRGPDNLRKPVVAELMSLLNTDVNNITATFLSFSDYDYLRDPKAAYASVKKSLKVEVNNQNRHIVIDSESPGLQSWTGFASALKGTSIYTIGLDCTEEPIIFNPKTAFTMFQCVHSSHIQHILKTNNILTN